MSSHLPICLFFYIFSYRYACTLTSTLLSSGNISYGLRNTSTTIVKVSSEIVKTQQFVTPHRYPICTRNKPSKYPKSIQSTLSPNAIKAQSRKLLNSNKIIINLLKTHLKRTLDEWVYFFSVHCTNSNPHLNLVILCSVINFIGIPLCNFIVEGLVVSHIWMLLFLFLMRALVII